MVKMWSLLGILVVLIGECLAETCKDIYLAKHSSRYYNEEPEDGLYFFKPNDADQYLIYCEFKVGHGYTYISTTSYQYTYPSDHNYDRSEFKIILLYSNGSQYQVPITFPKKSRKLDILYTYESYYNSWLSNDLMYPYITVSMKSKIKKKKFQGYLANSTKVTAPVCDKGNERQYARLIFGFLFNHNNVDPAKDYKTRQSTEYLKRWVDLATVVPDEKRIPRNFFSFFEVKHKNCGGYMTRDDFTDVVGAALGLKFVINCGSPPELKHASTIISGYEYRSTVTYKCDSGYEFAENKTTLTCSYKGVWYGELSKCIQKKPRRCFDHVQLFNAKVPGEYVVFDRDNRPYTIYCDFYDNYTLTFLTPYINGTTLNIVGYHFNDRSVAVIRSSFKNGTQIESEIRQLHDMKSVDLEYSYNEIKRYKTRNFGFRMYSKDFANDRSHTKVGYNINGVDIYHPEKVSSRTSIILLSVQLGSIPRRYGGPTSDLLIEKMISEARLMPGERYMPRSHFFPFDLGTIGGSVFENFDDLIGVNIGVRYNHY